MRIIQHDPATVIPDLKESDIDNNLVVAFLVGGRKAGFAYRAPGYNALNWFGCYINSNLHAEDAIPRKMFFQSWGETELLSFLARSWKFWSRFEIQKFCILESQEDLASMFNDCNVQNVALRTAMMRQLDAIQTGKPRPVR